MRESENNKRQKNSWREKLETILPFFSAFSDVIFGILALQFGILNIVILILLLITTLVIWTWLTVSFCKRQKDKKERYECKKDKFIERCNENVDIQEFYSIIQKNDKKFTANNKIRIRSYIITTVILGMGMLLCCSIIISQYNAVRGAGETGKDVASSKVSSNENINTVENTIVNEVEGNNGITPEEKKEMENKTFILCELERLVVLSDVDEKRVFYVTTDMEKFEAEVKDHINGIYSQKKKSTFLDNSLEEKFVAKIQKEEDIFLHAIDEAQVYKTQENYEAWKSTIPNSNTLEDIMEDRELLLIPLKAGKDFDGVLCIRLANNYQLLADEYKRQGGRPETVVYYYVEAIKRTEDGLAYEDIPQEYRIDYYSYLKARYKDIADYIENNLERFGAEKERYQQLMEKANAIYKAM